MKKLFLIFTLIPLSLVGMEPTQKNQKIVKPYLGMRFLFNTVLRKLPVSMKNEIFNKLTAKEVDEKTNLVDLGHLADKYFELEQEGREKGKSILSCDELFDTKAYEILSFIDERFKELSKEQLQRFYEDGGTEPDIINYGTEAYCSWDGIKLAPINILPSITLIKLFAENGADLNKETNRGKTPLISATEPPMQKDAAQELLKYGADINYQNSDGRTCLHNACLYYCYPLILQFLIDHGARVNIQDRNGETPLHIACSKTDFYFLKRFFPMDPGINNRIEAVKILLEAGTDISIENNDGKIASDVVEKEKEGITNPLIAMLKDALHNQEEALRKNMSVKRFARS